MLHLALAIFGCTPYLDHATPGIVNRGVIPLSANDAFLGSNIFLAREMERSPYLFNFIKSRGTPRAIEIIDEFSRPTKMLLFYTAEQQVYVSEFSLRPIPGTNQGVKDWIIRGPYAISRQDYRDLIGNEPSFYNKQIPLFIWGSEKRFGATPAPLPTVSAVIAPTPPPTPIPKPLKKGVTKKVTPIIVAAPPSPTASTGELDPNRFALLNTDQQALLLSRGFAARNVAGDVIHTVTRENLTLLEILNWYCKCQGESELDALASVNNLDKSKTIALGKKITIPVRLVKETKRLE